MGIYDRGLWGGVVVLGKAVLNTASDTTGNTNSPKYDVFEGLPDNQINGQYVYRFGGNDDNDNSGVMRYVSIRHGGFVFLPNKELNGLSLGAVGRGTTIDHVETYAHRRRRLRVLRRHGQHQVSGQRVQRRRQLRHRPGLPRQEPVLVCDPGAGKRDNGGEWNGEPNGIAVSNAPIANFEIYNATWIGAGNAGHERPTATTG